KKVSTAASTCCSANGLPVEISRSGGEHAVMRKSATTPTGKYAVGDRFFAIHLYLVISRSSPQATAFARANRGSGLAVVLNGCYRHRVPLGYSCSIVVPVSSTSAGTVKAPTSTTMTDT